MVSTEGELSMTNTSLLEKTVDVRWFSSLLLDDLLPHWMRHADNPTGLFHSQFDRKWRRMDTNLCTLVSQSRLIYNFCIGYELTGRNEYRDAVIRGADALMRHFQDREQGGWFWSCDLHGQVLDSEKSCYGHAFVIFGLANAARVTGRDDYQQLALETWNLMKSRFRDRHGGFALHLTRNFAMKEERRSQNPMMHTFEALLALAALGNSSIILSDAEELWAFIAGRMLRPKDGALPEFFTADWQPLPSERGGVLDIGHAFEWSFLLSQAALQGIQTDVMPQARRFLGYGIQFGYDPETGGIISPVTLEGHSPGQRKGWWEQCEAIRAMVRFIARHGEEKLSQSLRETVDFMRTHFVDSEYGGLYMIPPGMDSQTRLDKGSEWKVDYHAVGMCVEVIRQVKNERDNQ